MRGTIRGGDRVRIVTPVCLLLIAGCPVVQAAGPQVLPGGSFGFRAQVEGERFEARFTDYRVLPSLDTAGRPLGFEVEVDLGAIDSGDPERDAEMRRPEWFDVERHPQASFSAVRVASGPEGGLIAEGELRLKGVSQPIAVPFTWDRDGDRLEMRGGVELDRRWFGIGPADDGSVAAGVQVFFDLAWRWP